MKPLAAIVLALAAAACEEGVDKFGITPTGPSTYASLRIEGPTEVRVGQTVQYRSFARLLGANSEMETTAIAVWSATPAGRLTIGANGMATGASEGVTELTASIRLDDAVLNAQSPVVRVNVIAATAPPVSTSPPPTTTTTEVRVSCPATITAGDTQSCSATYIVNGVSENVTDRALWTSSAAAVAAVNNQRVTGVNLGSAFITALHELSSGRAEVTVVAPADGRYEVVFVPRSNTCSFSVRPVRTGVMTIAFKNGTLEIGGANQAYVFTYPRESNRLGISGRSIANGFSYAMEVTEAGSRTFTGHEDIQAPGGCRATYDVTLTRR